MTTIGAFKETYRNDHYPSILTAIHKEEPPFKEVVLNYLKNGKTCAVAPGKLRDVIDGTTDINSLACYTDGTYLWRSDVIYYFEKYNIDLPDDFISYVLRKGK